MEQVERTKPRRGFAWLWMILAVVMIAGFMAWLKVESKPTEVTVQTNETPEEAGIPLIPLDTFALHPDQYVGQVIRLQNVQAQSAMGTEAYWLDMPTQVPFLLKADSALAATGSFTMETGTRYDVRGRIVAMTDSVLNAWQQSGAIQSEGDRMQAEFATTFLEASDVHLSSNQGGMSSNGPGQGQGQQ